MREHLIVEDIGETHRAQAICSHHRHIRRLCSLMRSSTKSYTESQVAELLKIPARTLRRWGSLGLIESEEGCFDFQDLVSLGTITRLVASGVRPRIIARNIRLLARNLPQTARPLAQLNIIAASPKWLLAEIGDYLLDAYGQQIFMYETREANEHARPILQFEHLHNSSSDHTAEYWFECGFRLECERRYAMAAKAYQRSLQANPGCAEVHFNLGNVLRVLGRIDEAITQFSCAAEHNPQLAAAWYNLADLHEERGDYAEAAECLERTLCADPTFADARFNLAVAYEHADRMGAALAEWRRFLELYPCSDLKTQAQQSFARCERVLRAATDAI